MLGLGFGARNTPFVQFLFAIFVGLTVYCRRFPVSLRPLPELRRFEPNCGLSLFRSEL